jgi:hypothetical protein
LAHHWPTSSITCDGRMSAFGSEPDEERGADLLPLMTLAA